jgi:hypothetical protein
MTLSLEREAVNRPSENTERDEREGDVPSRRPNLKTEKNVLSRMLALT